LFSVIIIYNIKELKLNIKSLNHFVDIQIGVHPGLSRRILYNWNGRRKKKSPKKTGSTGTNILPVNPVRKS